MSESWVGKVCRWNMADAERRGRYKTFCWNHTPPSSRDHRYADSSFKNDVPFFLVLEFRDGRIPICKALLANGAVVWIWLDYPDDLVELEQSNQ